MARILESKLGCITRIPKGCPLFDAVKATLKLAADIVPISNFKNIDIRIDKNILLENTYESPADSTVQECLDNLLKKYNYKMNINQNKIIINKEVL